MSPTSDERRAHVIEARIGAGSARRAVLIAGFALGLAVIGHADDAVTNEGPKEKIEQIVVTGTRRPVPISRIGVSMTVIDDQTLQLGQQRDFVEVLRNVPGFNLARSGSRGGVSSAFVRGGEPDHNLILVDGVQVNRGGGSFDLATLSTDGLERVEIVRGPASALYGSDAVASVIQLITRRGEGPMQGSVRVLCGNDDTYEIGTSLSGGNDRFGYSVSAGRYATDGVNSLNNDADDTALRTRLDSSPSESWQVKLVGAYTDSAFDFPTDFVSGVRGGFPPIDPDQGRETLEMSGGLEVAWQQSDRLEHRLLIGRADSEDVAFDALNPANPSDSSDRKSDTDQDRSSGEYRLLWDALARKSVRAFVTLGYEYERERFDQRSRNVSRMGVRVQSATTERRRNAATYLQTEWVLYDDVFVTLAARLDDSSELGTELTPIGSIAWVLPGSATRLRVAFGRGIKQPSFVESFGNPGSTDGNPALDPETSKSAELGIDQSFLEGIMRTSLTYFRTDYDDLIGFVSRPRNPQTGATGTFINVQDVRSQGIEAEVHVALTPKLDLSATYTRLRTRVRAGAAPPTFTRGEDLLRRPTHSGSVSLGYTGERVDVRLSAALLGPRADRDDGFAPTRRIRNDDRLSVDLSTRYLVHTSPQGTQTRLLVRAENLLDDDDPEVFGFESPDLTVTAGVELRF
jgi:vitamin B12 transporter